LNGNPDPHCGRHPNDWRSAAQVPRSLVAHRN